MTLLTILALILLATTVGLLAGTLIALDTNRPDTEMSLVLHRFTLSIENLERALGETFLPAARRLSEELRGLSEAFRKEQTP